MRYKKNETTLFGSRANEVKKTPGKEKQNSASAEGSKATERGREKDRGTMSY